MKARGLSHTFLGWKLVSASYVQMVQWAMRDILSLSARIYRN